MHASLLHASLLHTEIGVLIFHASEVLSNVTVNYNSDIVTYELLDL